MTTLGFIPRTDIRQATQFVTYRWRPKTGALLSYGPNSFVQATWDHTGQLQDWSVRFPFEMDFAWQTGVFVPHPRDRALRRHRVPRTGEPAERLHQRVRWMDVGIFRYEHPSEFLPDPGLTRFIANARDAQLSLTLRPTTGCWSTKRTSTATSIRPSTRSDRRTIFDNHIVRTKVNYQFTREFSLREKSSTTTRCMSDSSLVALDRTKHLSADILLTYLVHPGTALYIGYTDGYDSIAMAPPGSQAESQSDDVHRPAVLREDKLSVPFSIVPPITEGTEGTETEGTGDGGDGGTGQDQTRRRGDTEGVNWESPSAGSRAPACGRRSGAKQIGKTSTR